MEIKLKIKSITYTGKSVGRDIRVEIEMLGESLGVDKRIKPGSTVELEKELGIFLSDQLLDTPIQIEVTEKDFLFSDRGKTSQTLKIDSSKPFPQTFEYQIQVQERRMFFWRRVAIFTIVIEADKTELSQDYTHGKIALYSDIAPELDSANLRAEQNDIVVLKTAVQGNVPKGFLSDLWHEVLYRDVKGFIHSSLIEISGQEREKITELIRSKARELGIDEKLALNLAYCESKWLPFAHSITNNKGIYQLGEKTIIDINQKYGGSILDPWNPEQNVDGGLRYFRYLIERYSSSNNPIVRILTAWNAGPARVPTEGPFDLGDYVLQVRDFVRCVLEEKRGEKTLKLLLWLLPWIITIGSLLFFTSDTFDEWHSDRKEAAKLSNQEITHLHADKNFVAPSPLDAREYEVPFAYLQTDIDGDDELEKIEFVFYSPEPFFYYTNINTPSGRKIVLDGELREAYFADLDGDRIKELIVQTAPGHLSETNIFSFNDL